MRPLFETYHLDNLETDEIRVLDGWSYCWGALFGPLYVLISGFPLLALAMSLVSCMIAALAFGAVVITVTAFDSALGSLTATLSVSLVALGLQGVSSIQFVRFGYIRRGWREWY